MADVKPFVCVRPTQELASRVAALPYDVYNRAEAKEAALKDPLSFLNIDRAESNLPDDVDTYDDRVYAKAKEKFLPHPAIMAVDIGDEPSKSDFAHYAKVVEYLNGET